jgi:hypothetical protein
VAAHGGGDRFVPGALLGERRGSRNFPHVARLRYRESSAQRRFVVVRDPGRAPSDVVHRGLGSGRGTAPLQRRGFTPGRVPQRTHRAARVRAQSQPSRRIPHRDSRQRWSKGEHPTRNHRGAPGATHAVGAGGMGFVLAPRRGLFDLQPARSRGHGVSRLELGAACTSTPSYSMPRASTSR